MAAELIWAFPVMRLPLLDANGSIIGRLDDIVVRLGGGPPRLVGFVAVSQRRHIFVNVGRVASLDNDGARLRSWDLDLNPFKTKPGELLVRRDLIDKRLGDEWVSDVALRFAPEGRAPTWEIVKVRLARRPSGLRRRPSHRVVDWDEVPTLFGTTELAAEAARLQDLHPSDVAQILRALPLARRRQLAESMEDDRLADLLEEMPEAEQLRLVEGLDLDRLVSVLEEMEYDDAADLLAEMPGEQRDRVLAAMDAGEAVIINRLLEYSEDEAGHLMNPDIIILGPHATVAEALATIRDPDWLVSVASQVFVTQAPWTSPTGTYLGVVYFQRLLREPPSMELSRIIEKEPAVSPKASEREVAERLAAYNLLAIPVCSERGQLLGAITVDDVLDRALPAGWRQRRRQEERA